MYAVMAGSFNNVWWGPYRILEVNFFARLLLKIGLILHRFSPFRSHIARGGHGSEVTPGQPKRKKSQGG